MRNQTLITACWLVWVLSCSIAFTAEPDWDSYAMRSRTERPKAIANTRKEIEVLRKNRKMDKKARREWIERLESKIADLEDPMKPYYPEATFKLFVLKVGDFGWIDETVLPRMFKGWQTHNIFADRIIDDSNLIAEIQVTRNKFRYSGVQEIPDGVETFDKRIWISGVDTSAMEKGSRVKLKGFFAVTGNNKSSGGAKLVLQKLDPGSHEDLFTRKKDTRTWTSNGGHSTDAVFVRYERGSVTLLKQDGKTVDVKLSELSEDDREYVRNEMKARTWQPPPVPKSQQPRRRPR